VAVDLGVAATPRRDARPGIRFADTRRRHDFPCPPSGDGADRGRDGDPQPDGTTIEVTVGEREDSDVLVGDAGGRS